MLFIPLIKLLMFMVSAMPCRISTIITLSNSGAVLGRSFNTMPGYCHPYHFSEITSNPLRLQYAYIAPKQLMINYMPAR